MSKERPFSPLRKANLLEFNPPSDNIKNSPRYQKLNDLVEYATPYHQQLFNLNANDLANASKSPNRRLNKIIFNYVPGKEGYSIADEYNPATNNITMQMANRLSNNPINSFNHEKQHYTSFRDEQDAQKILNHYLQSKFDESDGRNLQQEIDPSGNFKHYGLPALNKNNTDDINLANEFPAYMLENADNLLALKISGSVDNPSRKFANFNIDNLINTYNGLDPKKKYDLVHSTLQDAKTRINDKNNIRNTGFIAEARRGVKYNKYSRLKNQIEQQQIPERQESSLNLHNLQNINTYSPISNGGYYARFNPQSKEITSVISARTPLNSPIRSSQFGQQEVQQRNLNRLNQQDYSLLGPQNYNALAQRSAIPQQNQQQELRQKQEEDIHGNLFPNQQQDHHFATGGSVSNSYDPYLNTYNYGPPLSVGNYMDNQMPDSGYENGGYNDPYMSYGNAYDNDGQQYSFKEGGSVKEEELPKLADLIQRYGRNGDTELAHINPIEAHILKSLGGSGTINPATGLREYSFWKKPFKALKSVIGGGAGAIIGNMIAPGIGGIIGGALGQGAQHAARGKSALGGALKGAGMGAALPSVASILGSGASGLGSTALGSSLSNYGSTNAILPALGLGGSGGNSGLFGLGGSNPYVSGGLSAATALSSNMGGGVPPQYGQYPQMQYPGYPYVDNRGFLEKFGDNAKDYLTQPGNLLTLGTVAAQYAGRQKPKSPEKIAEEERRYRNASRKTIAEVEADEALETARADLQKKRKNKQLEEDIKNMGSTRRRVVSPEEFARTGRWLEYTDEEGRPIKMKGGGSARSPYSYLTEEIYYPASPLHYLSGDTGGQDDLIDAKLSDGEYVFDASTVSDLGDGNNAAGARKLDAFRENIRRHKRGGKVNLPPKAKFLESYLRG
jgi:hypothetical protein